MKKLLVPMVALLALSMLSTFVSASFVQYYMASFYSEAEGWCCVSTEPPGGPWTGPPFGKGSFHIRGSAIVREELPPWYAADRTIYPDTRLWARRTRMTVSWGNEKLMVYMWPSYTVHGSFRDDMDMFGIGSMSFFGYYKGEAGLQFVRGTAQMRCGETLSVSYLQISLVVGAEHWLTFSWVNKETVDLPPECVARQVIRGVTIWGPIPWSPSPP